MGDVQLPPQDLNAELSVLGSMALSEEASEFAGAMLCENDFYFEANGIVFRALKAMLANKTPCDPVTLCDEIVRLGKFEEIGGAAYIAKVLETVPNWSHVRYYANIVLRQSIRRRLGYLVTQARSDVFDDSVEVESLISRLSDNLDDLLAARSADLMTAAVVVQQMREEGTKPRVPYSTGLEDVDKVLKGGIRAVDITIVAARPSIGKTSLGMQISEAIAKRGDATLFISVEMTSVQLVLRVAQQGHKRADELAALPLFIEDRWHDIEDISNCIRMAKRRNMVKVVVIDYLQLIRVHSGRMQKHEQIEHSMKTLKWLAKELKIAVVVLAQINRGSEKRDDNRPKLSDLKGSGSIEEDADVVLLLHRPEFYDPDDSPGVADIIVAKNRNGGTGTVHVGYIKEKTMFVPFAQRPIDVSCYDADGESPF